MKKENKNTRANHHSLKEDLRESAVAILKKYGPGGPPHDPYSIAEKMQVRVEEKELDGLDGCVDVVNGEYVAMISLKGHPTRQRFTLAHELGHVVLMRRAENGVKVNLKRYRSDHAWSQLHQDPEEEGLCNCFAAELLMPLTEVRMFLTGRTIVPQTVWSLAKEFHVSTQVAAGQLIRVLGTNDHSCSLWNLDTLWPLPAWWTGFRSNRRADQDHLEDLVQQKVELVYPSTSYGNISPVKIKVTPSPEKRYALVMIMPD